MTKTVETKGKVKWAVYTYDKVSNQDILLYAVVFFAGFLFRAILWT